MKVGWRTTKVVVQSGAKPRKNARHTIGERRAIQQTTAAIGLAIAAMAWPGAGPAHAKVCDAPRQIQGVKTCADVDKAEVTLSFPAASCVLLEA